MISKAFYLLSNQRPFSLKKKKKKIYLQPVSMMLNIMRMLFCHQSQTIQTKGPVLICEHFSVIQELWSMFSIYGKQDNLMATDATHRCRLQQKH